MQHRRGRVVTRLRGVRCPSCGGSVFVPAVDNDGEAYRGCARCSLVPATPGRSAASHDFPSLAQIVAAQDNVRRIWRDATLAGRIIEVEHLATIAYALGVLRAERITAGERLDDGKAAP
jgi:hypothetical protein